MKNSHNITIKTQRSVRSYLAGFCKVVALATLALPLSLSANADSDIKVGAIFESVEISTAESFFKKLVFSKIILLFTPINCYSFIRHFSVMP